MNDLINKLAEPSSWIFLLVGALIAIPISLYTNRVQRSLDKKESEQKNKQELLLKDLEARAEVLSAQDPLYKLIVFQSMRIRRIEAILAATSSLVMLTAIITWISLSGLFLLTIPLQISVDIKLLVGACIFLTFVSGIGWLTSNITHRVALSSFFKKDIDLKYKVLEKSPDNDLRNI